MLARNDQPNIPNFNFAVNNVFNAMNAQTASNLPPSTNSFLLLNGTNFLLLNGSDFLLLL